MALDQFALRDPRSLRGWGRPLTGLPAVPIIWGEVVLCGILAAHEHFAPPWLVLFLVSVLAAASFEYAHRRDVKHLPAPTRQPWVPSPRLAIWAVLLTAGVVVMGLRTVTGAMAVVLGAVYAAYFIRHFGFAIAALRGVPAEVLAAREERFSAQHIGIRRSPCVEDLAPVDNDQTGPDSWYEPRVAILVPAKNEEAVITSVVPSILAFDYPSDLLSVVVIDDGSTDRTGELLDAMAAEDRRLRVIHRPASSRPGKSAALNDALELLVDEEVVVVYDADHRPAEDAVRRLVRHFSDPTVAAVQGRCIVLNAHQTPLSRLVAADYMAGYLVNEYGRANLHGLPAYGGANCAIRLSALREVGGYNVESVTEDTDVTLQLLLAGYRVIYDLAAVDAEEGAVTLAQYWNQRYRWATGHQQVWHDYHWAVWRTKCLSWREKAETTMFLYAFHLPVLCFASLAIFAIWVFGHIAPPFDPLGFYLFWLLLFLGPLLELGSGLLLARAPAHESKILAMFLPIFLLGVVLCTKAWVDALFGRSYRWVKTARSNELLEARS
jgi:1,2-diacylglycerol 3-beta-glucosyltransferase